MLFSTVLEFGLPWLRPDGELSFEPVAGWWCRTEGPGQLTVDWPGTTGYPFLYHVVGEGVGLRCSPAQAGTGRCCARC